MTSDDFIDRLTMEQVTAMREANNKALNKQIMNNPFKEASDRHWPNRQASLHKSRPSAFDYKLVVDGVQATYGELFEKAQDIATDRDNTPLERQLAMTLAAVILDVKKNDDIDRSWLYD